MIAKLTSSLAEQLERMRSSDLVDVILELRPPAELATQEAPPNMSRQEKIAARKEAFNRTASSVEEAIRGIGGEITGLAWINQTIRARVPADSVRELSEHDQISVLDIPHSIKADFN